MVSTFTPNIDLEEPARGDYVGTWDTPVNANMTLVDLILGGQTTISGAAGSVVLAAAQFQCKTITFNSTLLASITVTFPSTFIKSYEIQNICTGSSAFTITLQTTLAGREVICVPPGEYVQVINTGADLRFINLGRVGSYWDYAGSSVPNWVSGCTVPPYVLCDGAAFSSGLYPALARILGGTTLPDSRGRFRATLNQGTARLSTASNGIDGNTVFAAGSGILLSTGHIPSITSVNAAQSISVGEFGAAWQVPVTQASVIQSAPAPTSGGVNVPYSGNPDWKASELNAVNSISVAYTNASQVTDGGAPPSFIGGITMIRAA